MYLLQLPLLGGIAKYLYGFKPQQHYLLNKFSVAGLTFYNGTELINIMKSGETLREVRSDPDVQIVRLT